MNTLHLCWSLFACGLGLLFGLFLCFSPHGHTVAGTAFTLMFGILGSVAVMLAREMWGRRRYNSVDDRYAVRPPSIMGTPSPQQLGQAVRSARDETRKAASRNAA